MRRPSPQQLLEGLTLALAGGLVVGLALGADAAAPYAEAGFVESAAKVVAGRVALGIGWGALVAALYLATYRPARRRLDVRPASLVATAVASVPAGLAVAYVFNRSRGLRPSHLLEAYGLVPNLKLLALFTTGAAVAAAGLELWARRRLETPRPAPAPAVAGLALLAGVATLGPALIASDVPREPTRPHVIVLLVDALRADRLSAGGYRHPTTPAIDALAADGVRFTQAIAQSTFTKTSVASLFTGRFPYQHGVYSGDMRDTADRLTSDTLRPDETTLAELLRAEGYLTTAFVQNGQLRPYMGFDQGFVVYHDQQGPIERINRRFVAWLDRVATAAPVFAYLHYIDLHDPYRPEPPYDTLFGGSPAVYEDVDLDAWGAYLEAVRTGEVDLGPAAVEAMEGLYDGQLRMMDDEIGRLLDELKSRGLYEASLIVLTSDHGDGFMEHGFISHSTAPYDELIRVPLVVKLPGNAHAGTVVEHQVRSVDLLPTIAELIGVDSPAGIGGCSLVALLDGDETSVPWPRHGDDGPSGCEVAIAEIAELDDAEPTVAIRTERFKYLVRGGEEWLFDLGQDPAETTDLVTGGEPAGGEAELEPYRRIAERVRAERQAGGEPVELDERTVRELEALGYVH